MRVLTIVLGHRNVREIINHFHTVQTTWVNCHAKGTAHLRITLYPDLAAEHFHKPFGDRQSKPGSAWFAVGFSVALNERLKNHGNLLVVHSNPGIDNIEPQLRLIFLGVIKACNQADAPGLGEFDRISNQIDENLPNANRVGDNRPRDWAYILGA